MRATLYRVARVPRRLTHGRPRFGRVPLRRLAREPFPYLILPGFVKPEALAAVHADYPHIDHPGSFPVEELRYGPAFAGLLKTLTGPEMRQSFEEKFGLDLKGRPTMITARGRCGTRDGNIHTDAVTKIITVLLYMNPKWEDAGGCLRLLRSPTDIEDVLVEVPPVAGTLVAFQAQQQFVSRP